MSLSREAFQITSYGTLFIALCNEMFFLYAASVRNCTICLNSDHVLWVMLMFSLTVKLFRSTRPCVVGVLGAPKTCFMLCSSHIFKCCSKFISLFTLQRKQPWIFMEYPVMFRITFTRKIAKVNEVYLCMFQKFSCCYWICYWIRYGICYCLLGVVCHTFLLLV